MDLGMFFVVPTTLFKSHKKNKPEFMKAGEAVRELC